MVTNPYFAFGEAPAWAKDAVWYQIFPERFHNGDTNNDPTIATLEGTWPYERPKEWAIVPWTADWYAEQPWEKTNGRGFYYNTQLRRYGGDLKGILDKLDYLQELGINAIYLNPIFESSSLHKYGATFYHHVDNNFGPDPKGDADLWSKEDPGNPQTWKWTSADRLFLELIKACHARKIRIIIDGVFNHVGIPFWAFQKVRIEGPSSRYASWFTIKSWDDPTTSKDEFDYQGWYGIRDLPEFQKNPQGPSSEVKAHFRAVLQRWMDPNGDGNPEDGVDGWRLDVADQVPLPFWKEFRGWVKQINPNAYLTGEVWWEDYNSFKMRNARPWLEGDAFDSVMNYRFGDALFRFFNAESNKISAKEFANLIGTVHQEYGYGPFQAIQNVLGSHDTSRIGSVVVNPEQRLDHGANVEHRRNYLVRKPNAAELNKLRLMVAFQFISPGAPYIYYGDEVGMWGADDPDNRKPMIWPEFHYTNEQSHPFGLARPSDAVSVNRELFTFFKQMVHFRRTNPVLSHGDYKMLLAEDNRYLIGIRRSLDNNHIIAIFNSSNENARLKHDELGLTNGPWKTFMGPAFSNTINLPGKSFAIYYR